MSSFSKRMQARVNGSEPNTVAVMFPKGEQLPSGSEWTFSRRMDVPFEASHLVFSADCAEGLVVQDLLVDRHSVLEGGRLPGPTFSEVSPVFHRLGERRGFDLRLSVKCTSEERIETFEAALLGKVYP